jgi:RHS repeat-associated protein
MGSENFDTTIDLNSANVVKNRRMYGAGFDEPIARQDANGVVTWYGADRLGSVRQVFDNSGNVSASRSYTGFGAVTTTSGTGLDRIGYTGTSTEPITGLVGDNARQYDPGLGRWTSEDPLGFGAGDANLNRYVGNGATGARDPSGMQSWWDEFKMVGGYVIQHPLSTVGDWFEGMVMDGVPNLAKGAGNTAVELGQITRDVGNTYLSAYSWGLHWASGRRTGIYSYDLHSNLFKGYDEAVKKQNGSADRYTLNAMADGASLGVKPLVEGVADYVNTGDAAQASQTCGGVAAGNLAATIPLKLPGGFSPRPIAKPPVLSQPKLGFISPPIDFPGLPRSLFDPIETPIVRDPAQTVITPQATVPQARSAASTACPAPAAATDHAPHVFAQSRHQLQPRGVPYQHRTPDLPRQISLEELHRTRGIPGSEGVDLTAGSIDFSVYRRMWELSDHHGIEYGLVRVRRADGTEVWRMYSGSSGGVTYRLPEGAGERIVRYGGHTHPSRSPVASYGFDEDLGRMAGDVETLNRLWERMGYQGRLPHSRVIYGPNRPDTTKYFPNEGR